MEWNPAPFCFDVIVSRESWRHLILRFQNTLLCNKLKFRVRLRDYHAIESRKIYIFFDVAKLSALNRRDKRNARPALNTNQLESFFLQYRACSNMTFFCTWVLHYDSCPHASVSHWTVHHKDCGDLHEETPKYHWKRTYKQQKRKTICKWEIIGHSTLCCSK